MKNNKNSIGERIKKLRELKGLTQSQLGEELFVSDKTISKWEQDKSEPDSSSLVKLAGIFGVTIDYLITGSELIIDSSIVSKLELACREDNIALLDGLNLNAFDENGKNIEFYINKYNPSNVKQYFHGHSVKLIKEDFFAICGLPKGVEDEDGLVLLQGFISHRGLPKRCAVLEEKGYHSFKIFTRSSFDTPVKHDYQTVDFRVLNARGDTSMAFTIEEFADSDAGILFLRVFSEKTNEEGQRISNNYINEFYIKPKVLKDFVQVLNEIDLKNMENRHWGVPIYDLFFALKDEPKNNKLACTRYYIDPGKAAYEKLLKGLHKICVETLPGFVYRLFVNTIHPTYTQYCREGISFIDSYPLFSGIEKEQREKNGDCNR